MDCERFDQIVIDALYSELDELTLAAAKRHTEGCPRCQAALSGLRATRKIGVLPLETAPGSIAERALSAAREAQRNVSLPARFGRVMSRAAAYAMRPQSAMAAISLLAIGGAVLFLRPRPERSAAQSRVRVTERGAPEPTTDEPQATTVVPGPPSLGPSRREAPSSGSIAAASGAAATAPPFTVAAGDGLLAQAEPHPSRARAAAASPAEGAAAAAAERPLAPGAQKREVEKSSDDVAQGSPWQEDYARGKELYNTQRFAEAERAFGAAAEKGGKSAAGAELYAARSAEAAYGCQNAASKYEAVDAHYPDTSLAYEALWSAANCYKSLGDSTRARQLYLTLRSVAGYRDRAETEIASLSPAGQAEASYRTGGRAKARSPAPAKAAAAAPAADKSK